MREFCFVRLHIPTGQITRDKCEAFSELAFLRSLNQWNRSGETWKYWAE